MGKTTYSNKRSATRKKIDSVYIEEAMDAGHAPERTSNMGKYENQRNAMQSRRLMALVLAACLMLSLAVAAYAMNFFGLREMFRTGNRELPEAAVKQAVQALCVLGYSQSEAAQAVAKLDSALSTEELIRLALKGMASRF